MANPSGHYFKLDSNSGRFVPSAAETVNSPGDGVVVVTGAPDLNAAAQAVNTGGAIPAPYTGKWTVSYASLLSAIAAGDGNRAVFTAFTLTS